MCLIFCDNTQHIFVFFGQYVWAEWLLLDFRQSVYGYRLLSISRRYSIQPIQFQQFVTVVRSIGKPIELNTIWFLLMFRFTPSYQRRKTPLPATIPGISRSDHITILGVVFSSSLKFSQHVEYILSKAATTMFALRTLRAHGMAQASLHDICKAMLITQITYASPAWKFSFYSWQKQATIYSHKS